MARGNPNWKKKAIEGGEELPGEENEDNTVSIDIADLSKVIAENTAKAMSGFLDKHVKGATAEEKAEDREMLQSEVERLRGQKQVTIMLNEQESGDDPIQQLIGCNGVQWVLQRGKEVTIPEGILNVIKGCIYEKRVESDEGDVIVKKVPRFSYTVLG